jgi:hypothetical protein
MKRPITFSLIAAAVMIGVSLSLKFTALGAVLGPDGGDRLIQAIIGLWLAAFANFMPKGLSFGARSGPAIARWQGAVRLSGWAFTLAGLGYAAIAAFAPWEAGRPIAMALVAAALLLTLGNVARLCFFANRPGECEPTA